MSKQIFEALVFWSRYSFFTGK